MVVSLNLGTPRLLGGSGSPLGLFPMNHPSANGNMIG